MKNDRDSDDRLLTRSEVAEIFRVSPSTITRWAEANKLPSVKTLGGHHRYKAKTVMELAQHFIQEETGPKEVNMKQTIFTVPTMYGDHHVLEVRRLLLELRGVEDVNASSCFHTVEVTYNPAQVSDEALRTKLDEAGYLEELPIPIETGEAIAQAAKRNGKGFFRHTTAFEQTKQVINFAQTINFSKRPLWPCPGIGSINATHLYAETELEKEATHG